jgi:hypothetical protein
MDQGGKGNQEMENERGIGERKWNENTFFGERQRNSESNNSGECVRDQQQWDSDWRDSI